MSEKLSRIIFGLLLLCACLIPDSYSQTSVILSPLPQFSSYLQNGRPNAFGCVFTYSSGTTTPLATYTDSTGLTQNPNPVILTAGGTANIWIQSGQAYSFTVKSSGGSNCASGSSQYTVNGIGGGGSTLSVVVPYSPTPTFSLTAQNELISFTLTGNAVSLPLVVTGVSPPALLTFQLIENATGGYTFTWPSNVEGGCNPIYTAANGITIQQFVWNGTNAIALGQCVTNFGSLIEPVINSTQIVNSPGTYYLGVGSPAAVGDLVYLTSASFGNVVTNPAGNMVGIIGIAASLPTGSTVNVQQSGTILCNFDGATTAPDYVQASASVAGDCHDAGAAYPTSGQVLGRILTSIGSAGPAQVDLFGPEIRSSSAICTNGATVTVSTSTTSAQPLNTCAFSAGALNVANKAFRLTGDGLFIVGGGAENSSLAFGVGTTAALGTNNTLATQVSASSNWADQTQITCVVATTGATGSLNCTATQILSATATNDVTQMFTLSSVNLTGAVYVGEACTFNTASTSNTCTQKVFTVEQLN